jgi:YD repeat-containing protein
MENLVDFLNTIFHNLYRHVTNADETEETTAYTVQSDGTQVELNTDAEGNRRGSIYDPKGQVVCSGVFGTLENNDSNYDAPLPAGCTLPANVTYDTENKCYRYDGEPVMTYSVSQNDVMGRTIWSTDQTGPETANDYDDLGQTTSTTTTKGSDSETTAYTYDDAGNVLQETATDVTTATTYDKLGRPLAVTKTKNQTSVTTEYAYDGVYNGKTQTTMTDPLNRESVTEFDTAGKLVKETAGGKITEYTYDDNGNMLTSTLTDADFPGQSAVTTYTYDDQNRKTKVEYAAGLFVGYLYDDNGNVIRETLTKDGQETATIYDYDDMGRVTEKRKQIDQGPRRSLHRSRIRTAGTWRASGTGAWARNGSAMFTTKTARP